MATTTSPASSAESELGERVARNLAALRERIAATGRDPSGVRVVAVTKTFGPEAVLAAQSAGLDAVGENYLVELEDKRAALGGAAVAWHYLGALQSNKIARVAAVADVICTVSRDKEIERLAGIGATARLYVQVDFTGLAQRNGANPGEAAELVARARDRGLAVVGLMTVAPPDPAGAERSFRDTARLADELGLEVRSMGMSDDLELACRWGTSEVRVGRALFGPRAPRANPPLA
ncbi:MAG TPA: YggS family pyridoxal phosphate-dependent enzyme [Acidimicrobiales bacterium]|nr:YggS family pyridoxal phosphate-dependent enzyme [Acidimicrobiales bacterium]